MSRKKKSYYEQSDDISVSPTRDTEKNLNCHRTNKTISWVWKCQFSEGRCYLLLHLANIDFFKREEIETTPT